MQSRSPLTPFPCWLAVAIALFSGVVFGGCQQKMAGQPSYRPLAPCQTFADGRSERPLVRGTVARGELRLNAALYAGRKASGETKPVVGPEPGSDGQRGRIDENADFITDFPLAVDRAFIEHGRDRYLIYCVVCHDALGTGHGKIVERGYTPPPPFHILRLREAPVGRLFAVVSQGYGSMPSYAGQIPVEDRWAIVAYVRALQLSQHVRESELTKAMREEMESLSQRQVASAAASKNQHSQ
jgi:mono/diheme cytochrome c family protein